jgi:hypothetical protein
VSVDSGKREDMFQIFLELLTAATAKLDRALCHSDDENHNYPFDRELQLRPWPNSGLADVVEMNQEQEEPLRRAS